MRTFDPLDASKICKSLGGGGHKAAAGATMSGTLSQVKERLLVAVESAMEEANARSSSAQ